jgi:uncharacterized protein YggE
MTPLARTAAAALALAFAATPAFADDAPPVPQLQASGEGIVHVVPDIAIVTLGVTTRGKTASEALAQNSKDLGAAIDVIKGAGIGEKDIGTSGFSIYPVYATNSDGSQVQPPKVDGYEVSNEVRVTIREIAKSGAILDAVVIAGANRVSGISFDVADRKTPNDVALKDAILDAKRKAELMAAAAGVKLVRILAIASNEANGGPAPMFRAMAAAAPAVPIMPGEQQVSVNASVTWEIAPQ